MSARSAGAGGMVESLREIWRFRELLLILVRRDLKVRYKNSVLGFGWSLVNPLVQVVMITVVLQLMVPNRPRDYHAHVFCATLPWLFFSTAVMDSGNALISYERLMRRVYMPRAVLPLSAIAANIIHFLLALAVFLVYMALNALVWWGVHGHLEWPIRATALLIPIPVVGLALLVTGVAMVVSIWTLYFEDVRFITESGLRIIYWIMPVVCFYLPELILARKGRVLYDVYMLNPLSVFIIAFRKLVLPATVIPNADPAKVLMVPGMSGLDWMFVAVALVTSAGIALLGHRYFTARQWKLAERP